MTQLVTTAPVSPSVIPAPRILTPAARVHPRFPRWLAIALGVAVLLSLLTNAPIIQVPAKLTAIMVGVTLGMWLEERIWTTMVGRHGLLRILVGIATPLLSLVVVLPLSFVLGALAAKLGDEGTLMAALACGTLWIVSASLGSFVVVLLDVVISAVVKGFRSRVQLAVLGLMAMVSSAAVAAYAVGRYLAWVVSTIDIEHLNTGVSVDLGEGKLAQDEVRRLLAMKETSEFIAAGFLVVVAALALPAVLSAAGKIADAVMERLHPLSLGFRALAQGDLAVQVEEGGSQDFVNISRGFNGMTRTLAATLADLDRRNKDLEETNQATRRFVPFEFLRLLGKDSIRDVRHGEHLEVVMSVMFCDIRGFTTLAEQLGPGETFAFINRFLGHMEPQIHGHEGFIVDIMGDGIMALFAGSPSDTVASALGMLEALQSFNAELAREGRDPMRVGIGIHTGRLMLGTIGGKERLGANVVGDPANLASRVEGMTKLYGASIMISGDTFAALPSDGRWSIRELDRVRAKGKRESITVYEVREAAAIDTQASFPQALAAFRAGDLQRAKELFSACEGDRAAALYVERCTALLASGLPEGWSGVTDLDTK